MIFFFSLDDFFNFFKSHIWKAMISHTCFSLSVFLKYKNEYTSNVENLETKKREIAHKSALPPPPPKQPPSHNNNHC